MSIEEIKEVSGRIYFRASSGDLFVQDKWLYTFYKPAGAGSSTSGEQLIARVPRDVKGQTWIVGTAGTSIVDGYFAGIREYSFDNRNIYPVKGGFDGLVRTVSPASALAPIAGLIMFITAMMALLL
jgi:hypothetical protein